MSSISVSSILGPSDRWAWGGTRSRTFVLVEDVSGYVEMGRAAAFTSEVTPRCCCAGVRRWGSREYGSAKRPSTSNIVRCDWWRRRWERRVTFWWRIPWTTGTVELTARDIIRIFKASLNGGRRALAEWVSVALPLQWALNAAYRERLRACPSKVIFGREPGTLCAALAKQKGDSWETTALDSERVRAWTR